MDRRSITPFPLALGPVRLSWQTMFPETNANSVANLLRSVRAVLRLGDKGLLGFTNRPKHFNGKEGNLAMFHGLLRVDKRTMAFGLSFGDCPR